MSYAEREQARCETSKCKNVKIRKCKNERGVSAVPVVPVVPIKIGGMTTFNNIYNLLIYR